LIEGVTAVFIDQHYGSMPTEEKYNQLIKLIKSFSRTGHVAPSVGLQLSSTMPPSSKRE